MNSLFYNIKKQSDCLLRSCGQISLEITRLPSRLISMQTMPNVIICSEIPEPNSHKIVFTKLKHLSAR